MRKAIQAFVLCVAAAAPLTAQVQLQLDDGTPYAYTGQLAFSEVTADPATGTVTIRAHFPNPQGLLLPGMFVHAKLAQLYRAPMPRAPIGGAH